MPEGKKFYKINENNILRKYLLKGSNAEYLIKRGIFLQIKTITGNETATIKFFI